LGNQGRDDWRIYVQRPKFRFEDAQRVNEIIATTPNCLLERAVSRDERYRTVRNGRNAVEGTEIVCTDPSYIQVSPMEIKEGRFFNDHEAVSGIRVVVLGYDIADTLFPEGSPLGRKVVIHNQPFEVIGVLARQGEFLGLFSFDQMVAVPEKAAPQARWDHRDVQVMIKLRDGVDKQAAISQIEGIVRQVRGLMPEDYNDFSINSSDIIEEELGPVKSGIATAGLFITGLSLFVGAIGIMNITFVAVRERTREIGTRRAIGAPRRAILTQFLVEAVFICLLGGMIGLLLTLVIQNMARNIMPAFPLVFSWSLLVTAVLVSIFVGILSGFVPALMASRLDPAEALRHD
jgi:putative ABC transport system permease protein